MTPSAHTKPHILIVGGGFGGVRLAHQLAHRTDLTVTLVSDHDYFAYYPQLYHAATGGVRSESSLSLADIFAGTNVQLEQGTATSLDPKAKTITLADGRVLHYTYLALALGNVTNYFGIEGMEEYSHTIKTIDGAERFKQHLHQELVDHHRLETHYVVVGAGPTGVELAAALGEYLGRIARLHGVRRPHTRIDLVEAAPRVLPRSTEAVSRRVQRRLEQLGVTVRTGVSVTGASATDLKLGKRHITTETIVWTSGVANNPFYAANAQHFTIAKNHRVEVNQYLEGANHVYVLGDNANTTYTGLAQTAVNDANFVAADIQRRITGLDRFAYRPKRPITVTPVGPRWAVAEWRSLHLDGWLGWLLRRAADLIAYYDIEPLTPALKVWLQEPRREDNCPICDAVAKS